MSFNPDIERPRQDHDENYGVPPPTGLDPDFVAAVEKMKQRVHINQQHKTVLSTEKENPGEDDIKIPKSEPKGWILDLEDRQYGD